jgi:hypothetical protein
MNEYVVRAIKCDRCGDRLEIRISERQDRNGKPYYAEDLSEVESHATAHAYRSMEARYGPDESKWPSRIDATRRAVDAANTSRREKTGSDG